MKMGVLSFIFSIIVMSNLVMALDILPSSRNFSSSYGETDMYFIKFKNSGNETVKNITYSLIGNISFTKLHFNFTSLKPNETHYVPIDYEIPINANGEYIGTYIFNMSYGNETIKRNYSMRFKINDNVKPIIETFELKDTEVTQPLHIKVNVTDNVGVVSTNVTFYTDTLTKIVPLQLTEGFWIGSTKFDVVADWKVLIYANDVRGNQIVKETKVKTLFSTAIEFKPVINFNTLKRGQYSVKNLLVIKDPIPYINITLTELYYTNNSDVNFSLGIQTPTEAISFLEKGWSREFIDFKGTITLVATSLGNTEFSGKFDITGPQYLNLTSVTFSGSFKNYSVCELYNTTVLGHPFSCRPVETELYETSRCVCNQYFPIDTNFSKMDVATMNPMLLQETIIKMSEDNNRVIRNKDDIILSRDQTISFIIWVLIIIVVVYLGVWKFYPIMRFKMR